MNYLENIKRIRKTAGLTQIDMSERLGLTKNNYGKVENGQVELTVNRLYQIADILGVSVTTLLEENVGNAQKIAELEKINEEIEKKNRDLQADLDRTKEMFDAVWPFAKTILSVFKNIDPKTFIENPDRDSLLANLKEKGFELKDESLLGLKLP
ncbi:helix-turn-helix domain-containing protein [Runella salmonicolor]|uniref:Helix-turn-helix domain-containing protein n=1 Tax=Runella salmonicolor TaxID=2950278 RepID=A0ABT1FQJ5_9BACT|nr:helix-turn-helix transcriptional regulator [Runella salmonicolor]MCP1384046.1 helix-turn-helix domain-containing protein [Runella salmonicolor]